MADVPQFAKQVAGLSRQAITLMGGTASEALPGDPLLLGDWIKIGKFDPHRLARRFDLELGGAWRINCIVKDPKAPTPVYDVDISRVPGT